MHMCSGDTEVAGCGCLVERCRVCGAARSVSKCAAHVPVAHDSREYYLDGMNGHEAGVPMNTRVCKEAMDALFPMRKVRRGGLMLDVAAGTGKYVPLAIQNALEYHALEVDAWAAGYLSCAYGALVYNMMIEDAVITEGRYDLIVASHCLEHFCDAKAALQKIVGWLAVGGSLVVVVPDDRDLGNPDHLWFFRRDSMLMWLDEVGIKSVRSAVTGGHPREDYMYFEGVKA